MDLQTLTSIVVAAKAASYVGGGHGVYPCRTGAHDVRWSDGAWHYLDSYFGGTDFIGQETLWQHHEPVWSMAYYGRILDPARIDAARAGATIKAALGALYGEDRFLGGHRWAGPHGVYDDTSAGDARSFTGHETITVDGAIAYRLDYFGGLIRA
jgi:hypothetical protein